MARTREAAAKAPVTPEIIEGCIAKAVAEGDIVNFRFCFIAYSPLRETSSEDIHAPKYAYLRPEKTDTPEFRAALALVREPAIRRHVQAQLEKKGNAQYPWELILALGDNAVRLGKYTSAAQAYEMLRIRARMMDLFFRAGEQALDADDLPRAVRAFLIAIGLSYDYSAFPEPLPSVPNFQTKALMLHAIYPRRPEECVALLPPELHLRAALEYLLLAPEAAARLEGRPVSQRMDFIVELVRQQDAHWPEFARRYRETCAFIARLNEQRQRRSEGAEALAAEIDLQQQHGQWAEVPARLLGRTIPGGTWWQYLKELAYQHPAAPLFISRQFISEDLEILLPRYIEGAELVRRLELAP
jgi:hypothetical protein